MSAAESERVFDPGVAARVDHAVARRDPAAVEADLQRLLADTTERARLLEALAYLRREYPEVAR